MDDVKRKVLLDLFGSPSTLLPLAGGLSMLMGSWATGGNAVLNFAGVASILGGLGMFATRLIFGLERITNRAYEYVVQQQQQRQQEALDGLDEKLTRDRDSRTESCLRRLRQLYTTLKADIQNGNISAASSTVVEGVDRLFLVCVRHLEQSLELWEKANKLQGSVRERLLTQREETIQEVTATIVHLEETIERLQRIGGQQEKSELAQLRRELDESVRAARRAEERVAELSGEVKSYDLSEFES